MRFFLKFAAKRKWLPSDSTHVRPVKTAPPFDSSTLLIAVDCPAVTGVAGGPHPDMVPSLVAKMKSAGLLGANAKSAVPLKTIPLGDEGAVTPSALGTVTTKGTTAPAPVYRVAVPVPELLGHHGVDAPRASPQGFFKCGSTVTVVPSAFGSCGTSEIKFLCT